MSTDVYANNNEVASKAADSKSAAAFPDVCFTPPAPPVGPMPLPYPNTGEVKDTEKGTAKVFVKDKMSGMEGDSYLSKSMGDEAATQSQGKGIITGALQGKCYFGVWSMDVKMEGKGVPRHLDMVTHNHASQPAQTVNSNKGKATTPAKIPAPKNWMMTCSGSGHRNKFMTGQTYYEVVCDIPISQETTYNDIVSITENPKISNVTFNKSFVAKQKNSYIIKPDVNIVSLSMLTISEASLLIGLYKNKSSRVCKSHHVIIDKTSIINIKSFPGDHFELNISFPGLFKKSLAGSEYSKYKYTPHPQPAQKKINTGGNSKNQIKQRTIINDELYHIVESKKTRLNTKTTTQNTSVSGKKVSCEDVNIHKSLKIEFIRAFPDVKNVNTVEFPNFKKITDAIGDVIEFIDAVKKIGIGVFVNVDLSALDNISIHIETGFIEVPHTNLVVSYTGYTFSGTLLTLSAEIGAGLKCSLASAYIYVKIECELSANIEWLSPAPLHKQSLSTGAEFSVTPSVGIKIDAVILEADAGAECPLIFTANLNLYKEMGFTFSGRSNGVTFTVSARMAIFEYEKTFHTSMLAGEMFSI